MAKKLALVDGVPRQQEESSGSSPTGAIVAFGGTSAPTGWLICDGSAVSRATYSDLFSALGVAFGEGDGSTTFHLPDLRGRFLRGFDDTAGNDPDSGSRIASNTGGNTGNAVGSLQADATARPNSNFTGTTASDTHSHNVPLYYADFGQPAAEFFRGSDNQGSTNTRATNSDTHSHSFSVTGGGDNETRPVNVSINFIIKI